VTAGEEVDADDPPEYVVPDLATLVEEHLDGAAAQESPSQESPSQESP